MIHPMPELQSAATKVAAAEYGDVSVELWSNATEPPLDLLSLAAGNAHLVVTLHSRAILKDALGLTVTHRAQTRAEWLEIGTFASCPVNIYTNKDGISLICDGPTMADYPASFAIYFAGSRLDWFCDATKEIAVRMG